MKTLISICCAFILLFPFSALSQRRPDRFTIGYYNFEITLPSRPTDVEPAHFKLLDYNVYGEIMEWDLDRKQTATIGIYHPIKLGPLLAESAKPGILAAYAKVVRAGLMKKNSRSANHRILFPAQKGSSSAGPATPGRS